MSVPFRIYGTSPVDKRKMVIDWWLIELARYYFHENAKTLALVFAVRTVVEGYVQGRFFQEGMVGAEPIVELKKHMLRLYLATEDAFDYDSDFAEAFLPFCQGTEWKPIVKLSWKKETTKKQNMRERVSLDWFMRPRELPAIKREIPKLDPEIEGVLEGLEALDDIDELLLVFKRLYDVYYEPISNDREDKKKLLLDNLKMLLLRESE